jgi:hypothetical protein
MDGNRAGIAACLDGADEVSAPDGTCFQDASPRIAALRDVMGNTWYVLSV